MNKVPSVVIPKVPNTVKEAPILIPVSTYLVPISIPLKNVTSRSLMPTVATPLKTDIKKDVMFSKRVSYLLLFSHLNISKAGEKSILSTFLIKTPLNP